MSNRRPISNAARLPIRNESLPRLLRDAFIVVLVASGLGLLVNMLRPTGSIPLVQRKPYDIVVPCPEPVGIATATPAADPRLQDPTSLLIDARSPAEFAAFHLPRAINIPFDWLGPPVESEVTNLAKRVAGSKAQRVIVYGDGDDPDSGREWARLLAGGGIKNVFYVTGGASALGAKPPVDAGVQP